MLLVLLVASMSTALGQSTPQSQSPQKPFDLNTVMMESTFRIEGQAPNGAQVIGTGFLMGRPLVKKPGEGRVVLITAAHVFNDMAGDSVSLVMRRQSSDRRWEEVRVPVPIRSSGHPLWVQHPEADVAALYIAVPNELTPYYEIIATTLLANDSTLNQYEIHPGDELECLGYPLGYQNPGGFPILRSGKIASYPLVPSKENPYFLLDFRVFRGNSGGPVYFAASTRFFGGSLKGGQMQFVMGLVSQEVNVTEQMQSLYENRLETYPLGLAKIVPAEFIAETVNLLPSPE